MRIDWLVAPMFEFCMGRDVQARAASGNAESARFAKLFKNLVAEANLKTQQFSYAADEVISGRASSLARRSEIAPGILKNLGGVLGPAQIANEYYKDGFAAAGANAAHGDDGDDVQRSPESDAHWSAAA